MTTKQRAKQFSKILKAKGYSQYLFASKTEVSMPHVYRLCNGERKLESCTITTFMRFAKVLGYETVDELCKDLGIAI